MSHRFKSNLNIGCWNVNGLISQTHNKLEEETFVSYIMKHDIIGIVETHANANSNCHIPNYYVYQKHRPKLKKARKYSGGLAVFIKQEIKEEVTILQSRSAEMLWIKLDKFFLN